MGTRHTIIPLSLLLVFSLSCASISRETIAAIEKPVDCSSASEDVAYLDDEKSGFFGRLLAGITAGQHQRRQDGNFNGSYPRYISHIKSVLANIEENFAFADKP
jgi:hypothetical protein